MHPPRFPYQAFYECCFVTLQTVSILSALRGDRTVKLNAENPCFQPPGGFLERHTTQLTLDGVLHSINEAGTTLPTERWYGSEAVIDRWLEPTLVKLGLATQADASA